MLQFRQTANQARTALALQAPFPPAWKTMKELEHLSDDWLQQWLTKREDIARRKGRFALSIDALDRMIRTNRPEHTDNPDVSPKRKLKILKSLHRTNLLLDVYRSYINILTPAIMEVSAARKRPARLLEIASGSGEMAMTLASLAVKKGLPVEVTGSDYVAEAVEDAKKRAERRGLPLQFRVLNAFNMDELDPGEYDIILIVGTMHHFTPGQLAVIMFQSRKTTGAVFIGIDGYRSLPMLIGLPAVHLATLLPDHIHDAWLTARKFYTLCELECIAKISLPDDTHTVTHSFPGLSVIRIGE